MNPVWSRLLDHIPESLHGLTHALVPVLQIAGIGVVAVLLQRALRRLCDRVTARYSLPLELNLGARRLFATIVYGGALLLALERLGVSGAVLWSAFTGFAAVAAVAFFAAWSVLSNIFCSVLIFTTGIFRISDRIELLEAQDRPGLKGRVIDINLIYTTLDETGNDRDGTVLKVPNSLFFQRTVRQWRGSGYRRSDAALPPKPFHPSPEESASAQESGTAAAPAPLSSTHPSHPLATPRGGDPQAISSVQAHITHLLS